MSEVQSVPMKQGDQYLIRGEWNLKDSMWGELREIKWKQEREAAVDMLFKKMGCFNASFSPPTRKHLYYLRVCVNFLSFIVDWWRLEFLKLLLIRAHTSTYHTNARKEIHEVKSNSLTTILVIDEHFQDLRELSSLAFQIVLKKKIISFSKPV